MTAFGLDYVALASVSASIIVLVPIVGSVLGVIPPLLVVLIELGQLTPPMGLNLFAIHSIAAPTTMGRIAWSAAPYAALITALCFLLYFYPQIALWLPATLKD